MAQDQTTAQDPNAQDNGSDESESIVITITATPDGQFTVALSGDEDQTQDDSQDEPQTADNIDDALKMAKEMYTAESGEESSEPSDESDGNTPMSPEAATSAWKQMASKKQKMSSM